MKSVVALFFLAAIVGAFVLPIARRVYLKLGKLDQPDGKRKLHEHPVPRAGGVGIFLAFSTALALFQLVPAGGNFVIDRYSDFLGRLFPAVAVMFLTGLLDDWMDLRPKHKLVGQTLAAGLAYWAGVRILTLPDPLVWLEFGLTVLWLVLCANAFNLIDGSDGLAGSVGLLSSVGLVAMALVLDYPALALLFAPLAGGLAAFLRENWPPARVFMGDSGSLTIGFLLGCGGAALSRRYGDGTGLLAAVLLLALPLAEVAISTLRRSLRGRPVFEADCQHIHHQLRQAGCDARSVLMQTGVFTALGVLVASSLFFLGTPEKILLLGFLAILFLAELADLPYIEFRVVRRALSRKRVAQWLQRTIFLAHLRQELQAATSAEQVWVSLRAGAKKLGISQVHLRLGRREWRESDCRLEVKARWRTRVDLPQLCWVEYSGSDMRGEARLGEPGDLTRVLMAAFTEQRLKELLARDREALESPREVVLLDRSA